MTVLFVGGKGRALDQRRAVRSPEGDRYQLVGVSETGLMVRRDDCDFQTTVRWRLFGEETPAKSRWMFEDDWFWTKRVGQ